jgi:two-component system, NarL family, nitrate/nitrite response regulator NarL
MTTTFNYPGPVLVVDDDSAFRELVSVVLNEAGYETLEAGTGKEALRMADETRPAVVISDVLLPEQSGYELCRSLREKFGETLPILLLSGVRTEPLDSVVALLIGADDYITKPLEIEALLARVHRSITRSAASASQQRRRSSKDLTPREQEVLRLLSSGLSQKKIAERLVISSKTVATHIQRILAKLGVHSRAEAVALAYRTGLLAPDRVSAGSNGDAAMVRATSAPEPALDSHLSALTHVGSAPRRAAKRSERAA